MKRLLVASPHDLMEQWNETTRIFERDQLPLRKIFERGWGYLRDKWDI